MRAGFGDGEWMCAVEADLALLGARAVAVERCTTMIERMFASRCQCARALGMSHVRSIQDRGTVPA